MKSKFDEFLEKSNEMADKAEAFLKENYEKAKASETYAKVKEKVTQATDLVEKKIDELNSEETKQKIDKLKSDAESKAEGLIDKAKAYGTIIANDVDEAIDQVKEKLAGKSKK